MKKIQLLLLSTVWLPMAVLAQPAPAKKPKNIIFLIGDGMGTAQIFAGLTANKGTLNLGRCTAIGFQKTQASDQFVTDSGAGGTALAIGQKTYNGAVGVDATGQSFPSIMDIAKQNGLATGLVVTCSITHATPADYYAHQKSRSQLEDIALDLLNSGVDVFVGGGRNHFTKRKDGRNLLTDFAAKGYAIADSTEDLSKFKSGKLAYFTADLEPRKYLDGRGDVLPNGTTSALNLLSQNPKGFFLMVEGSQIDWGGHANSTEYVVSEMLDFDRAVGQALDFAQKDGNTLVVITADHETGGMAVTEGDMKTGKVEAKFASTDHTGIMVPVFAYGPGAEAFIGIYENTAIYSKLMTASGLIVK